MDVFDDTVKDLFSGLVHGVERAYRPSYTLLVSLLEYSTEVMWAYTERWTEVLGAHPTGLKYGRVAAFNFST